jgi:hypothetical protein
VTAAACPRRVRDEVSDVLSCLNEALRHPGIGTALALLLSGKRPGEDDGSPNQHSSIAPTANPI